MSVYFILKKNKKTCNQRVYQSPYTDIANDFIQYIHSLEFDEIEQLVDNIKVNRWGVTSIVDIKNSVKLLQYFEIFVILTVVYQFNRFSPVLNGKTYPGAEKIFLKRLYEIYRFTKSHGLVSLQFLSN